jgi:hypothetical protein
VHVNSQATKRVVTSQAITPTKQPFVGNAPERRAIDHGKAEEENVRGRVTVQASQPHVASSKEEHSIREGTQAVIVASTLGVLSSSSSSIQTNMQRKKHKPTGPD